MNKQNWTIQEIEGGTKITPANVDILDEMTVIPPAGSTTTAPTENVRTTMEILKTAFQAGKEIAHSRTTTSRVIVGREPHTCVFKRLCKTKVLFVASNGYDLIIQKACECGKRIAIDNRRVIL